MQGQRSHALRYKSGWKSRVKPGLVVWCQVIFTQDERARDHELFQQDLSRLRDDLAKEKERERGEGARLERSSVGPRSVFAFLARRSMSGGGLRASVRRVKIGRARWGRGVAERQELIFESLNAVFHDRC